MKKTLFALSIVTLALFPHPAAAYSCGWSCDGRSYTVGTVRTDLGSNYHYNEQQLRQGIGGAWFDPFTQPGGGPLGSYVFIDVSFRSFQGFEQTVDFVVCQDINRDGRCSAINEPFLHKRASGGWYFEMSNPTCNGGHYPIIVLVLNADAAEATQSTPLAVSGNIQIRYGVC